MKYTTPDGAVRRSHVLIRLLMALGMGLFAGVGPATHAWQESRLEQLHSTRIPADNFSRIIQEFSEEDGFFRSDNFVSNETSYLHVVPKLQRMSAGGGAYIGVGPEQNFTYIAKIRPQIAFIVDIRRQAVIQHLLYKALFQLSDTRARFLSYLFSKPLSPLDDGESDIERLIARLSEMPADPEAFVRNLDRIRKTIKHDFRFPLLERDKATLEYVYSAFRDENLGIRYRSGGRNWPGSPWGNFPSLRDLILQPDLDGKLGNFLASEGDYRFVRDLQRKNRIIPVVGDFAGNKALASVADYLKQNSYTLTAFYTSNVEQYLFANGVFRAFEENVRKFPVNDRSLFIRAFPNMREPHPARVGGHRLTTLLQKISVFLEDCERGLYQDYWTLVTTNFIAPETP
jgi:hypothetical protein